LRVAFAVGLIRRCRQVIVGSAETLANTILRLASERGLMGLP
jgi:hypothetical protein